MRGVDGVGKGRDHRPHHNLDNRPLSMAGSTPKVGEFTMANTVVDERLGGLLRRYRTGLPQRGTVKTKRDPADAAGSTQMRPCQPLTILRQMARPAPVPSIS